MSEERLRSHALRLLAAAHCHPECLAGRVANVADGNATIELDINVEMPLHMKADEHSPNGVYQQETVQVVIDSSYPWSVPVFYLRSDFPRDLPHLQPGSQSSLPQPCLVDANLREYFFQFGIVEHGIFQLVNQLALWLQRATQGELIAPQQGWEPILRQDLANFMVIDAEVCRSLVDRKGGHCVFSANYYRTGPAATKLSDVATAHLHVSNEKVPLNRDNNELFAAKDLGKVALGNTICCLIWPDKMSDGAQFVASSYLPETVTTLNTLYQRANELRCKRALETLFNGIERYFRGKIFGAAIPIGIVLCARRPFHLIGSTSEIELLPYIVELRAKPHRISLFPDDKDEPVAPATQLDMINPALLRTLSGLPVTPSVSLLGCGSLGSKMALHLVRCGVSIPLVSDKDILLPHNMARHALARPPLPCLKANELANELFHLGQIPQVHKIDLVKDLHTDKGRRKVLPKQADFAINTTASLGVREALSNIAPTEVTPRLVEAAMFGNGQGSFLLSEGQKHNPTLCDLVSELYATASTDRLRQLLFDTKHGLTEIQIGQGCGSLTMPMTDMRLSAMAASLSEALVETMQVNDGNGKIVVGTKAEDSPNMNWFTQTVSPFEVVPIKSADNWALRLSPRVIDQIHVEMAHYPTVETGGVLIGMCSARLKAITVVDLLPAPSDSIRSATHFTLGTNGLEGAIKKRHRTTGGALFDVGTWHSHLADQGPSARDWETAQELAGKRPPPSALLIITPKRLYSLMHTRTEL